MISNKTIYIASIFLFLNTGLVYAGPVNGQVVAGGADISKNNGNTVINQHTNKAIINWDSFNVNKNESVKFNQINSSSVILNRVTNGLPSSIYGDILANGNVFILNSAGILIGKGASINTGSFLATTGSISNENFLKGNYIFNNATGSVINEGNIKVRDTGYAVLLGKSVENNGYIHSRLGRVVLASGDTFRLDMSGNNLIGVAIEKDAIDAYTLNSGTINGEGATIIMSSRSASDVIKNAVNNTGVINASSIQYSGGHIVLGASGSGVSNTGEIIANSEQSNGGKIDINGKNITNNGKISANGNKGSINLYSTDNLYLNENSNITVNAYKHNNAGNINIISEKYAYAHKNSVVSATAVYGDGGFIEFSGYEKLAANGNFYTISNYGLGGTFLLDPSNMFIGNYPELLDPNGSNSANKATGSESSNSDSSNGEAAEEEKDTNNTVGKDGNTYIDVTWLQKQLNQNGSMTLESLEGNGAGNITFNEGIDLNASGKGLTVKAANDIFIKGNINIGDFTLEALRHVNIEKGNITAGNFTITANNNISVADINSKLTLGSLKINSKAGSISIGGKTVLSTGNITANAIGNITFEELSLEEPVLISASSQTGNVSLKGKFGQISNIYGNEVTLHTENGGNIKTTQDGIITGTTVKLTAVETGPVGGKTGGEITANINSGNMKIDSYKSNIVNRYYGKVNLKDFIFEVSSTYKQDGGIVDLSDVDIKTYLTPTKQLTIKGGSTTYFKNQYKAFMESSNLFVKTNSAEFYEDNKEDFVITDAFLEKFKYADVVEPSPNPSPSPIPAPAPNTKIFIHNLIYNQAGNVNINVAEDHGVDYNITSREGAVTTKQHLTTNELNVYAEKDILVDTSSHRIGVVSNSGDITLNVLPKGPITPGSNVAKNDLSISELRALNGKINIDYQYIGGESNGTSIGTLNINKAASNQEITIKTAGSPNISIDGSGDTDLTLNIDNKYTNPQNLITYNYRNRNIIFTGMTNTKFKTINLSTTGSGNITLPEFQDGIIKASDFIKISANDISGDTLKFETNKLTFKILQNKNLVLNLGPEGKVGSADISGNNINITLEKDTNFIDLNDDKIALNSTGTMNISGNFNVKMLGNILANNISFNLNELDLHKDGLFKVNGNNISIDLVGNLIGSSKIIGNHVSIKANTIAQEGVLLIDANTANLVATSTEYDGEKPLINISVKDQYKAFQNFQFSTFNGKGAFMNGIEIDQNLYGNFHTARNSYLIPIENSNLFLIDGDILFEEIRRKKERPTLKFEQPKQDAIGFVFREVSMN